VTTIASREAPPEAAPAPAVPGGRRRWTRLILPGYTWLMIAYFCLPIAVMIVFGFNDTKGRLNLRWQGFTLTWYRDLFSIPALSTALRNSLLIAVITTVVATVLGTMVGIALGRYRFPRQGPLRPGHLQLHLRPGAGAGGVAAVAVHHPPVRPRLRSPSRSPTSCSAWPSWP
jgi:spermidine/putrescine transport system permease protein